MKETTLILNHEQELRQLSFNDAKEILLTLKNNEIFFINWIDKSSNINSADAVKTFLTNELNRLELQHESLFTFYDKTGFLGITGFYSTDKVNNKTELVIWTAKRARTIQNYSDLIESLLKLGFTKMNFNRIQVKTPSNDFSLTGVLRKSGFINEGIERGGLVTTEKTYEDLTIYGIIKSEYIARSKFVIRAEKMFQRKNKQGSKD